jgi:MinD-like ATPase involved in chromosome partitioning or flagellar assembly
VGVTIHGVRSIDQARETFDMLASALERDPGRSVVSYGLLLDDLDVYRAIVNRRPIGVIHPQSRASRALADVARLLLEDAAAPEGRSSEPGGRPAGAPL